MDFYQKIKIAGVEYNIVDSIQDFRAEDSFIHRSNKLAQYIGSGESRKHVGTYAGDKGDEISRFFEYNKWGTYHRDETKSRKTINSAKQFGAVIQEGTCFFSKSNLLRYLEDAKAEYLAQEQIYHNDISEYYEARLKEIEELPSEYIYFTIYDVSDNKKDKQDRGYIRSDDEIWNIWRKIILPKISYLSILKLEPQNPPYKHLYYFRILLDFQYRSFVHPGGYTTEGTSEDEETTLIDERKKAYRIGQDKYRKAVIDHMPQCPFTKISDERLLVASHIKPYAVCIREKKEDEALDYLNGLSLSPTYDWLFDQGYITFSNKGELICGTQLSQYTWSKLNINPASKNILRIYPENREIYLEYHRKHVFLDNIQDLVEP